MNRLLIILFTLFTLSSCQRWIAPPYTSPDKASKIRTGMTLEEVNTAMGIKPYDVYFLDQQGAIIVTYKYRVKHLKTAVGSSGGMNTTDALATQGETYYVKEEKTIFVEFKDGKMVSLISDSGFSESADLLMLDNTLYELGSDSMNNYVWARKYREYLNSLEQRVPDYDTVVVINEGGPTIYNPVVQATQSQKSVVKEQTTSTKNQLRKSGVLRYGFSAGPAGGFLAAEFPINEKIHFGLVSKVRANNSVWNEFNTPDVIFGLQGRYFLKSDGPIQPYAGGGFALRISPDLGSVNPMLLFGAGVDLMLSKRLGAMVELGYGSVFQGGLVVKMGPLFKK